MTKIEKIKAAQVAAAQETGDKSPYANAKGGSGESTRTFNRIDVIKQQQIDTAEDEGKPNPYAVAIDLSADDQTAIAEIKNAELATLDMMQAAMSVHLTRIAGAKDLGDKAAIKAELINDYLPFVKNYVEACHNYPNDVAVIVCIWLFDIGQIEAALKLGVYLLKTNMQVMPTKFDRDLPTFIADSVYDWANVALANDQGANPYLSDWVNAVENNDWDLHPAVVSKNLVMLAKHAMREEQYKNAVDFCTRAETVNPEKAGVKTLKAKALKLIPEKEVKEDQEQTEKTDSEPTE